MIKPVTGPQHPGSSGRLQGDHRPDSREGNPNHGSTANATQADVWDIAMQMVKPRASTAWLGTTHHDLAEARNLLSGEAPTEPPLRAVRRMMDLAIATLLVPIALIAFLVALILAGRPVIFIQTRVGRGGRTFRMLKFRTMVVNPTLVEITDPPDGRLFKSTRDPRITSIGRIFRRWSIDELPQIWNVFKGEMSIVGPRPALPAEVAQYDDRARRRYLVKPGLTGLWQVSGRSDLTWDESVSLDLHYIEDWSLWLELAIIARTIPAILSARGAY